MTFSRAAVRSEAPSLCVSGHDVLSGRPGLRRANVAVRSRIPRAPAASGGIAPAEPSRSTGPFLRDRRAPSTAKASRGAEDGPSEDLRHRDVPPLRQRESGTPSDTHGSQYADMPQPSSERHHPLADRREAQASRGGPSSTSAAPPRCQRRPTRPLRYRCRIRPWVRPGLDRRVRSMLLEAMRTRLDPWSRGPRNPHVCLRIAGRHEMYRLRYAGLTRRAGT